MAKIIKNKKIPPFVTPEDIPKYLKGRDYFEGTMVKKEFNFEYNAGQKLELSKKWYERLIYVNQFFLLMSVFSLILTFLFLSNNESPTLLANFTDGRIMCANEPINLNTEKSIGRESKHYEQLCHKLNDIEE